MQNVVHSSNTHTGSVVAEVLKVFLSVSRLSERHLSTLPL